jgi:zinc ribbon protein/Sel1 repeat-containing protein
LLCSNCGYENPRDHRYCGMCGTPFPYRALTVPGAQSTLNLTATPIEVAPADAAEPVRAPVTETEPSIYEPIARPTPEPWPSAGTEVVTHDGAMQDSLPPVDTAATSVEEQAPRETLADVPHLPVVLSQEAAPVIETGPSELEPPPTWQSEVPSEPTEPSAQPVNEPERPAEPPAPEPEVPEIREPEPEAPEVIREPPPKPEEPQQPAAKAHIAEVAPTPVAPVRQLARRLLVTQSARSAPPEALRISPQNVAKVHPSPDSLPITPPPASAGMPTFKEVSEASGPPDISPFEPPKESHTAEDQELKEFVANFRWTPPAETADELTMRSEVPVIDKEAPAEFRHPSFDDDVAPPAEAGPHPTGQEFYEPDGTAPRPRFLEVGEKPHGQPVASGISLLGLDNAPSQVPPAELAGGSKRRGWLWVSILALLVIFGGLGYLEGRAQSTHEFSGPIELVRREYNHLRERLLAKSEPAAPAPENKQPEAQKTDEPQTQPDKSEQPATTQPDTAQQTQPEASPAANAPPPDNAATVATQPAGSGASTEGTDTAPAKPIEAPPTKSASSKPQPGQQELAKALNASDSAAAAAWLWKSTSRGNPEAPVRLAEMYIRGNGVTKSCEQALVLLRSAAMKDNAPARNRLASLYANGTCVTRDRVKAYQLMSSALEADPTSEWAKENRQQLWNQMTLEQRAEAQKVR